MIADAGEGGQRRDRRYVLLCGEPGRTPRPGQPASFTVSKENGAAAGGTFPGFCVVAANSAYLAGGTPAAPDADVTDGLLDVVTVSAGSKLSFVRVMLLASRGRHTRLAQVGITRAPSVTVSADRAMLAGADGEPLTFASPLATGVPLCIRALRGVLRCVMGPVG